MVLEMLVTVSHFAATTPAILVICLGATIFLAGVGTITMMFYRRKTSAWRKGGVFLREQSEQDLDQDPECEFLQSPQSPIVPIRIPPPRPRPNSRLLFNKKSFKFRFDYLAPPPLTSPEEGLNSFGLEEPGRRLIRIHPGNFLRGPPRPRGSLNSKGSLKENRRMNETLTTTKV